MTVNDHFMNSTGRMIFGGVDLLDSVERRATPWAYGAVAVSVVSIWFLFSLSARMCGPSCEREHNSETPAES